jgi:predicted O-methyltransferase YrrM
LLKNKLGELWYALKYDAFIWSRGLRHADKIPTHMTADEKIQLYRLVQEDRPRVIVEIGSYLGASSCFLARSAQTHVSDWTLFCVDTWNNDAMPDGNRDTFDEFRLNTKRYAQHVQPIRQKSEAAAKGFNRKIDLLFIDGDHDYEGVSNDWECWSPHLQSQCTVVMHDIGWAAGVQRVVEESIEPLAVDCRRLPNLYVAKLRMQSAQDSLRTGTTS